MPELADMRQIEGEAGASEVEKKSIPYGAKVEVLVAGALFNIIFALVLACVVWGTGYPVLKSEQTRVIGEVLETVTDVKGVAVPSPAREAGLQAGDVLEKVDGRVIETWSDFRLALAVGTGRADVHLAVAEIDLLRIDLEMPRRLLDHAPLDGARGLPGGPAVEVRAGRSGSR